MKSRRLLSIAALVALAGCSFLFDPGDLGRRVRPGGSTSDGGDNAAADDSAVLEGAAGQDSLAPPGDEPGFVPGADSAASIDAGGDWDATAPPLDAAIDAEAATVLEAAVVDTAVETTASPPADATADVTPPVPDAGPATLSVGLVAYYPFDETSGTTAADLSGNGHTALMNGATFTAGRRGNAATMDGSGQYVSLPIGIVAGLTSCSISLWTNLVTSSSLVHLFDFGIDTTTYISMSSNKFAITVGNLAGEERVMVTTLSAAAWHHVVVTLAGAVATVYVDGRAVKANSSMTLNPSSLGTTTQNWIGKSQDIADAFLNGKVDQFRIYGRALTPAEVQQLFQLRL
ncbi:MAG: hypothetical protein M3O50_04515 [Myxococcota bacterium]|nr:hypothetical protein [Myxococcota bacterium]